MGAKRDTSTDARPTRWYPGADVPASVIRRYARQVAERFHPEKIVLFGSHAYGTPHADSDVDILIIMPARNPIDQAFKIRLAVPAPFSMDLIVRTPQSMKWRLEEGDLFHTEIVTRGKVLYEKGDQGVGWQSRLGFGHRHIESGRRPKASAAPRFIPTIHVPPDGAHASVVRNSLRREKDWKTGTRGRR